MRHLPEAGYDAPSLGWTIVDMRHLLEAGMRCLLETSLRLGMRHILRLGMRHLPT
jgi:hypothetical protein